MDIAVETPGFNWVFIGVRASSTVAKMVFGLAILGYEVFKLLPGFASGGGGVFSLSHCDPSQKPQKYDFSY